VSAFLARRPEAQRRALLIEIGRRRHGDAWEPSGSNDAISKSLGIAPGVSESYLQGMLSTFAPTEPSPVKDEKPMAPVGDLVARSQSAQERVRLMSAGAKVLGPAWKPRGSNADLRREIATALGCPADKSDAFVTGWLGARVK
jgi:hypothetical protein